LLVQRYALFPNKKTADGEKINVNVCAFQNIFVILPRLIYLYFINLWLNTSVVPH